MTLEEMKQKTYQLIEEYDEEQTELTNDPDLAGKINSVINQIQNELARIKKITANKTMAVKEGQEINLTDIDKNIYQLYGIRGVDYETMLNTITFNEEGTARIYYYKYPTQINDETEDDFVFELSRDVLEVMPYGVAADLLKSDVSSQYGSVYAARYQQLLNELDVRYSTGSLTLSEGIEV
jgi:hypothetical protein